MRARLLLLSLAVAATALVGVALLSRRAVRSEFLRFEAGEREQRLAAVAAALPYGGDLDATLAREGRALGRRLLLLAPDGRLLGASSPELREARIEAGPGGRLTLDEQARRGDVVRAKRTVLVGGPRASVLGRDGLPRGTLYALPALDPEGEPLEPGFVSNVNRSLLLAALASGALALLLSALLSRRLLRPIEQLTEAARRMGSGDLAQRVTSPARDEIGALGRAFNAMADALERQETLRRNLVNDVAHELRTPLTNLRCQVEALQDGLQSADAATLRSLHEETLLLSRLVDDLQDLALAEAGRLPLQKSSVALGEAVEAALSALRPLALERGVSLRAELAPLPRLEADRERLGQILRNLLANALTHTPAGGEVVIAARAEGNWLTLVVRDSGSGIAAADLPHVFDRFYRADPSRARATGGAGLGLAIVKQLVEAHGGRVSVVSPPGQGASFQVTLPAARA